MNVEKPGDGKMLYFNLLSREEQADAIRRLSRSRMSDQGIAAATGLSVEMIRRIIGNPATLGRVEP